MRSRNIIIATAILFAVVLTMSGCKIVYKEAELRDKLLENLGVNKPPPPMEVALLSYHDRYVYATDEDNWAIRQVFEDDLSGCRWLTLEYHWNGKITLKTCHGLYITAPASGKNRKDWMLMQEFEPGDCSQFDLYELGNNKVALKTCAGNFLTAGDNGLGWEGELSWAIVGETDILDDWEYFTIVKK